METPRRVRGVLGGSQLFEQPAYRAEVEAWTAFLAAPGPALLEIGFDHGRRLTSTAAEHPAWRVAGLEVRKRRVDEVAAWGAAHALHNLFAWRADARTVLANHTPAGRLDVIEALFPVPWPDGPADKRWLLDDGFLGDAARALRPGGLLYVATDVAELAGHLDEALSRCPTLRSDPDAAALRPTIDALSRREWKCAREATPVHRRWLRRALP